MVIFIVTDNEGASSEAVVTRVNFIVRDNKPTVDLNAGSELPGQNVSVEFYDGGPAVMGSVINVWLCVKCVTVVG